MRFSLGQLERIVPELLQRGLVNILFEGYPILHSVAIELRDEKDQKKHWRYLMLIKMILQCPGCNPDVLDKHRKSSLMYAAEKGNLELLLLLLNHHANPNLVDGGSQMMTAMEWGIFVNPKSSVIKILNEITKRTDQMLKNFNELFDRAIEDEEIDWINVLLDLKLVHYQKCFRTHIVTLPEIPKAFWMRTLSNPEREKNILKIRERFNDSDLTRLRHKHVTEDDLNYTPYSPCTLVREHIPISLFHGLNEAALMIRTSDEPIVFWYDGHKEELTNEMRFHEGSHLSHGTHQTGQFWEITPKEIQSNIEGLYVKQVRKCQHHKTENPKQYDQHGILLDRNLSDIRFSWNEGLLRYKHKQVFGIHVDPENKKSVIHGLKLRQTLELDVPLYHYDSKKGVTHPLDMNALLEKWNLKTTFMAIQCVTPEKPVLLLSGGPKKERFSTICTNTGALRQESSSIKYRASI